MPRISVAFAMRSIASEQLEDKKKERTNKNHSTLKQATERVVYHRSWEKTFNKIKHQSFLWPLLYDIGVGYLFTTQ
jgi:adenylate kinase family enzyme